MARIQGYIVKQNYPKDNKPSENGFYIYKFNATKVINNDGFGLKDKLNNIISIKIKY